MTRRREEPVRARNSTVPHPPAPLRVFVFFAVSRFGRNGPLPRDGARGCIAAAAWAWLSTIALAGAASAGTSPRDRICEGNEHFAAGRYTKALEAYEQVPLEGESPPDYLPELLHNRAAALFKLGKLDDARELWVRAAGLKDATFEAQMRYNIGNVHYAEALRALGGQWAEELPDSPAQAVPPTAAGADAAAAGRSLDRAIEHYRDALRLDPQLASARANLELAARLKKLLEQQQPASQPQSQPDPNQQQQEKRDREQPQSRPASQPSSQPSQEGRDGEPQQDPNAQRRPDSQPQSQPSSDESGEEGRQEPNQPTPLDPNQLPKPDANQAQPVELEHDPNGVNMTIQEAERLLQMIRDAEKARREALRLRMRGPRPVEKDW